MRYSWVENFLEIICIYEKKYYNSSQIILISFLWVDQAKDYSEIQNHATLCDMKIKSNTIYYIFARLSHSVFPFHKKCWCTQNCVQFAQGTCHWCTSESKWKWVSIVVSSVHSNITRNLYLYPHPFRFSSIHIVQNFSELTIFLHSLHLSSWKWHIFNGQANINFLSHLSPQKYSKGKEK